MPLEASLGICSLSGFIFTQLLKVRGFLQGWPLESECETQFPLRCHLKQGSCIHILWANADFSNHAHLNVSVPERKYGVTAQHFQDSGWGNPVSALWLRKLICSEKPTTVYHCNNYSLLVWERSLGGESSTALIRIFCSFFVFCFVLFSVHGLTKHDVKGIVSFFLFF